MASSIHSRKRLADLSGLTDRWPVIEETVQCIFKKEMSPHSFQRIHHSVFQLCQSHFGNNLLEHLEELFRAQVAAILERLYYSTALALDFLQEWEGFYDAISQVSSVLLYFDKNYMLARHHSSIELAAERIFCTETLGNEVFAAALIASIKQHIDIPAAEAKIRNLGQDFYTADGRKYFVRFMEIPFMEAKVEKYRPQGQEQKASLEPPQYLQWVQDTIQREREKCTNNFFYILLESLTTSLYQTLILDDPEYVQNVLLGPFGLEQLVRSWDIAGIAVFAKTFGAMKQEKDVIDVIARIVKETGESILTDRIGNCFPFAAISDMLHLITKSRELDDLFSRDEGGSASPILRVVRNVLGSNGRFMETVSLYYDSAIRLSKDDAMEAVGNNTLTILQLTPDLEPFEVAFRGHLAARLIHAKPRAVDMESLFIDRLFNIYGTSVVNRFQKMVEDIRSATAAQEKLVTEMVTKKIPLPLDLDVLVLTSGLWPQYAKIPLNVPASMEVCKSAFYEYYRRRHNGRKLVFQMSLGSLTFLLCHGGKQYHVSAHTHFVNTILALNSNDNVDSAAVTQKSGLGFDEVLAQFNALSAVGLVEKSGDAFRFNQNFFSAKPKVKVSTSAQKATPEGGNISVATRRGLDGTRTMCLDATIVKILKTRKSHFFSDLQAEVVRTMRDQYVPTKAEIKRRLELLVEKSFVRRDERADCYFYCT